MIVDSSAVLAVLLDEPEAEEFSVLLVDHPTRISAANWLEAAMVAESSRNPTTARSFDRMIEVTQTRIEPVTAAQARTARAAFRRYGRGSGSPARLNFGDCFAYALAAETGEPLLFKGDDFPHTDVPAARG